MRLLNLSLLSAMVLAVSACATEPPPCTAEWVQWRKDRILREFASDNRQDINRLRDLAVQFERSGGSPGLDMAVAAMGALGLVGRFLETAAPAVQEAVGQCGSAPRAAQLFADMLRQEGVSENVARSVERLGAFAETTR